MHLLKWKATCNNVKLKIAIATYYNVTQMSGKTLWEY